MFGDTYPVVKPFKPQEAWDSWEDGRSDHLSQAPRVLGEPSAAPRGCLRWPPGAHGPPAQATGRIRLPPGPGPSPAPACLCPLRLFSARSMPSASSRDPSAPPPPPRLCLQKPPLWTPQVPHQGLSLPHGPQN